MQPQCIPKQIPFHREFVGDDTAALLKPVVDQLALITEFDQRPVDAQLLPVDSHPGYAALTELPQLPTAAGQTGTRRMNRLAFALRTVVGHVKVDRTCIDAARALISVVCKQIIVELQGFDINALERPTLSNPGSETQWEFAEGYAARYDLCRSGQQHGDANKREQHARGSQEGMRHPPLPKHCAFGRRHGKLDAEQLSPSTGLMTHPIEQCDLAQHQCGADHEYHPTLELVEEALGHADAPMLDHHTDGADAKAVHQQRDRDARQK